MEAITSQNRIELLQIADAVAREKVIERDTVLEAMEDAKSDQSILNEAGASY